jgi:hypothetical protein
LFDRFSVSRSGINIRAAVVGFRRTLINSDTRYQLKGEPIDERRIGRKPKGHYAWTKRPTVTMEEARAKWGV